MSTYNLARDVEEGEQQMLPKRAPAGTSRRRTAVALALAAALIGVGAVAARKSGVSPFQYAAGADTLKLVAVTIAQVADAKAKAADAKAVDAKDDAANKTDAGKKDEEHRPQGLYGDVQTDAEFAKALDDFVKVGASQTAHKTNYMKIMSTLTGGGDHQKAKEEAETHLADIVDMMGEGHDHYTKMEAANILVTLADTQPRKMSMRNAGAAGKCLEILAAERKAKDNEFFPEKTVVTTLYIMLKPNSRL